MGGVPVSSRGEGEGDKLGWDTSGYYTKPQKTGYKAPTDYAKPPTDSIKTPKAHTKPQKDDTKPQKDYTKPRQTIQSPDRLYKAREIL